MKVNVFVQAIHGVTSPADPKKRMAAVTFGFSDPAEAEKAGLAPNTGIQATFVSGADYPHDSEHVIEIKPKA